MDKLEIVPQESKSSKLATEPVVPLGTEVSTMCPWVMTSGGNSGGLCGRPCFDGDVHCATHKLLTENAARKAAKKKDKVEEFKIVVKASEQDKLTGQSSVPIVNVSPPTVQDSFSVVASSSNDISNNISYGDAHKADILEILKNFSAAIANLTELLKR